MHVVHVCTEHSFEARRYLTDASEGAVLSFFAVVVTFFEVLGVLLRCLGEVVLNRLDT